MKTFTQYLEVGSGTRVPVHQTAAYQAGIRRGAENEADIRQQTKVSCGWELIPVTNRRDDMNRGIDAYLVRDGQRHTVQLKSRKQGVGSDLGYEIAADRNANDANQPPPPEIMLQRLNGRDMRTVADYTALLDQSGRSVTLFHTTEGHEIIHRAVEDWLKAIRYFGKTNRGKDLQRKFAFGPVSLVYRWDQRDHYWKIMCYIRPEAMRSFETCQLQSPINTRFGV